MIDETCRNLAEVIALGGEYRIDAFCVLTGRVEIGGMCHIGAGTRLIGSGGKIQFGHGSGTSLGCTVLTASDNFLAPVGLGPLFPKHLRSVKTGDVIFEPLSGIGAHTIVLPGITLGFGAKVGANSLLTRSIPPGEFWTGSPAKKRGDLDLDELKRFYKEFFE